MGVNETGNSWGTLPTRAPAGLSLWKLATKLISRRRTTYYGAMEYAAMVSADFVYGMERAHVVNTNSSGCLHAHGAMRGVCAPLGRTGAEAIRKDMRAYIIGSRTNCSMKIHKAA